jgi:hypothetical protein
MRVPVLALIACIGVTAGADVALARSTGRGRYCQTIVVPVGRGSGHERWKVYRVGGSCAEAKRVLEGYQTTTLAYARAGKCLGSTCVNAPQPPGFRCSSSTAGGEAQTGHITTCRGHGAVYRDYSR